MMIRFLLLVFLASPLFADTPLDRAGDWVFGARDGRIAVEAEHFFKAEKTEVRDWKLITASKDVKILPDGDPSHAANASGGSYLEALPDTRRNHGDKLIVDQNFCNEAGKMAVLSYKVQIDKPGRYYVWVRTFSTNTEDNGIHVGLNGTWPESGKRMQWTAKRKWAWGSKQRTAEVHTGVEGKIWLDIESAGEHVIQFSMREDGFEFDKFILTPLPKDTPQGAGPEPVVLKGKKLAKHSSSVVHVMKAADFQSGALGQYMDRGKWLAVDPDLAKEHLGRAAFPLPTGLYDVTLQAVGEDDGQSTYTFSMNGESLEAFQPPLSKKRMEEGEAYAQTWKKVKIEQGGVMEVLAKIGSADGKEYARARWLSIAFTPADQTTMAAVKNMRAIDKTVEKDARREGLGLVEIRKPDGDESIDISGELRPWLPLTLTLDGPFAHEKDKQPNPFTDHTMEVTFTHESGKSYTVPGYFAADGNAGETSAESGTKWRAHLSPDLPGKWKYSLTFKTGEDVIYDPNSGKTMIEKSGEFVVNPASQSEDGFYSEGRLQYVGKRYLQFAGSKRYFLKVGADAPETLLAYVDFDGTVANTPKRCPLKTFQPHLQDWTEQSPSWKGGKGKGLIGALNYLSGKGVNAFSFLTYNAGGDGDNVWPFISRNEKFHYDCSKLDQWNRVFTYAQHLGLFLHFKLQETENDDNRRGHKFKGKVPTSLDGGKLGVQRKLYYREIIARYGHHLALNWNVGEENTQTTEEQNACIDYIKAVDAYGHLRVIHTYPGQQEKVYRPLLGNKSALRGTSLQNDWSMVHHLTAQWVRESEAAGIPWVVANDEQNSASAGTPPDTGYKGFEKVTEKKRSWDMHDIRKQTLWGNLMAGGAGVEYYFGYKLAENDLLCEDWRSRDKTWEFGAIALRFFRENGLPFETMTCRDDLVGNPDNWNAVYCLANTSTALVYLPNGGERAIDFPAAKTVTWFNPRNGEKGEAQQWAGQALKAPDSNDWLAILR